jgi:hypothetical protein
MDIIAHALWTTALASGVRRRSRLPIHLGWAAFWGVFPDTISFTIPAVLRVWWRLTGASRSLLPEAHGPRFEWVWGLYNCSHSAVVFAAFFGTVWLFARRPVLEMLGWAFHILIDIFTHRGLFATHFLWPVSSLRFNGLPCETGWFLALNYAALALVFLLLWGIRGQEAVKKSLRPAS